MQNNKIKRYSIIGMNNISNSYVQSIANMGLIDKKKEHEYAGLIIQYRTKLISLMFSNVHMVNMFLEHFNRIKSKIIHAKYVFELSKYVTDGDDIDDAFDDKIEDMNVDDDEEGPSKKVKRKKNIFNDINNIINNKVKKFINEITDKLKALKNMRYSKEQKNEIKKEMGLVFQNLQLSEAIIKDFYQIFIKPYNEIENYKTTDKIFGVAKDEYMQQCVDIQDAYNNMVIYTEKMILSNLRLVISVSKKYINRRIDFMDIVQEGNLGLIKATKKFDHTRGFKFSTYATWWIKQSITRDIYDNYDAIRIPIHMKENVSRIFKNISSLDNNLNYDEKIMELTKKTTIDPNKVKKVFKIQRGYISLDKGSDEFSSDSGVDFIDKSYNSSPYHYMVQKDKQRIIDDLISDLAEREHKIFKLRYPINKGNYRLQKTKHEKEMTLERIGYIQSITRERVRQIINKIIIKLMNNKNNAKYKNIIF